MESLVESHLSENYPALGKPGQCALEHGPGGVEEIATTDGLMRRIGEDLIGARPGVMDNQQGEVKTSYGGAGSFVGFLLENPIGPGYGLLNERNFGALYQSTPLRPLERDPGAPDRWQKFYRGKGLSYTFGDLALLWKTYMHFLLFDAGAAPVPIPDDYRRKQLVAKLYNKLGCSVIVDKAGVAQRPPETTLPTPRVARTGGR